MDCVVNDKHRYIMFYGAKAACSSLRTLYLAIHQAEMSDDEIARLDSYHNLNEVHQIDPQKNYRRYFKFYLSRNPYGRVVSAFLDQYTFAKNLGVQRMLEACPPSGAVPDSFIELLRYLREVPDHLRDTHFQTQAFFAHGKVLPRRPYSRRMRPGELVLNYRGDIGEFNLHLSNVFKKIFKHNPKMRDRAIAEIHRVPKLNNLLYGKAAYEGAAELAGDELQMMPFLPKPQDFFASTESRSLVQEIYADDFRMFGYDIENVPHKKPSSELAFIPDDFDWQTYALLNPDLAANNLVNERTLTHHYLMHGRLETKKRFYRLEAPEGFAWQSYLDHNADLPAAGIDNERDALIHYLTFGYHEQREY